MFWKLKTSDIIKLYHVFLFPPPPQLPVKMIPASMENVLKPSIVTSVIVSKASMERSASMVRKRADVVTLRVVLMQGG